MMSWISSTRSWSQVTVDGVMQGNGGASDEDRRNGFERGGWALGAGDDETRTFITETYQRADAFLRLGRQLHARGSLLVALITVPYDLAPAPNSSGMGLWSSKQQRSGSARPTLALDGVDADRNLL